MHELSLALEIRDICERELTRRPENRVTGLGVDVGALSGVEVDNLRFCLEVVMAERYGEVRCEIRRIPAVAQCVSCSDEFRVRRAPFVCPGCGAVAHGVRGGGELQVTYVDVE